MSWARELCDVYDKNEKIVGIYETENLVLAPIFHTTVSAQITVILDQNGNFLSANLVPEDEKITIIPVTEKSASRSSGVEAHPLCDNLKYVAGDYFRYVVPEKGEEYTRYYQKYIEGLQAWAESEFSHKKVKAIYQYLKKGNLIQDLVQGCLVLGEDGKLEKNIKLQKKILQMDAFVRFQVEKEWTEDRNLLGTMMKEAEECWKDRSLHRAYIDYCRSQRNNVGFSYLTGEKTKISYLHPKGILKQNNMAKLISSNDSENFTFRGRFKDKEEAFAIGYEDSQKLHNALKWLLLRQGREWDSLSVVVWESDFQKLPDWSADTDQICEDYLKEDFFDEIEEKEEYMGTNPLEATKFTKAILGYGKELKVNSKMQLLAFDAASKGRLAILANENLSSSFYLENLNRWHTDVAWNHWSEKKKYYYYGVVSIENIARLLYGNEQNGRIVLTKNNEKVKANICKRLIPCVLFGRLFPEDLVHLAISRASSPLSYENRHNWEQLLSLACSLIKKKKIEQKDKEEWSVALKENCDDRNYLYGRLLAVADRMEYRTFEKEEKRITNAKRYMNAFSQRPFQTWDVIENRLISYLPKLDLKERLYYEHLKESIYWLFKDGDFEKNEALDGLYLLGFYNQSYALRNRKMEEE